jgi:hypothetical protein
LLRSEIGIAFARLALDRCTRESRLEAGSLPGTENTGLWDRDIFLFQAAEPSVSDDMQKFGVLLSITAAAFLPAAAQPPVTPLDILIANHGSLTVGDITFSNFQKPKVLPSPVALLGEFNDIGVSTTTTTAGAVGLMFSGIDPATGSPRPLTVGGAAGAELVRLISYNVTVNNPALRLHSVDQSFGPGTSIPLGDGSEAFNFLYGVEPAPNVYDLLMTDQLGPGPTLSRGANMPSVDGPGFSGTGGILLPGGNLAGYSLANEFGFLNGHGGVPVGGTLDSFAVTFSLVPAGTPAPPVVVNLASFSVDGAGIGGVSLSDYAQEGGAVVTLASSKPAALAVPATVTVPQGSKLSGPFVLGQPNVDVPTPVTLSASFNGTTLTQMLTVNPAVPLTLASLQAVVTNPGNAQLLLSLNRENATAETILLASSNPAVAPVPASFTIPALTQVGDFRFSSLNVPLAPVGVDTPVTFSATFGGVTAAQTITVPRTVDTVKITKAELVVKTLSLKVEATSTTPTATLTLFNAFSGQLIGIMTNLGAGKFSFEGTVSPVQTLLLTSTLHGNATGDVAQK